MKTRQAVLVISTAAGIMGPIGITLLSAAEPAAPRMPGKSVNVVLNTHSYWRCYVTHKTMQMRRESGKLEYFVTGYQWRISRPKRIRHSPLPSTQWTQPDFDDSSWALSRGPFPGYKLSGEYALMSLCVRGKFEVKDPTMVGKLNLSLAFRGGAVVHLNGKELARAYLPQGKIDLETPALDYSKEAYLSPEGMLLRNGWGEPEKYADRFRQRMRHLSDLELSAAKLRRGINVLAIEVHRAPVSEIMFTGKCKGSSAYCHWAQIGIEIIELTAAAGAAVAANLSRPEGFQIWNQSVVRKVRLTDFGDPNEPRQPIRLAGTRNGVFSGQVVVGSTNPIRGLKVQVTGMKEVGGRAVIPTSAVRVRYPRLDGLRGYQETPWFDGLVDEAPPEVPTDNQGGAVQPVWLTIRVPEDAKPGQYQGKITISTEEVTGAQVPVELTVADWTLPDPREFHTHVGLIQSPESVAMQYDVPIWSEKHWKLLEKSFALLGQVGTKVLYIPVRARTYFGNPHSMVRWVKQPNGSFKHDFSIVERYLDLALKHLGKIPVVCIYCWDVDVGGQYFERGKSEIKGTPFTILDPASGKLEEATSPRWGTPESCGFWKPVFDGMRNILAQRGLAKSMMVGICGDQRARKEAVDDLKAVAPEAGWVVSSHGNPSQLHGQPVGYLSHVWGISGTPDPDDRRISGWKNPQRIVPFPRAGSTIYAGGLRMHSPLAVYRLAAETALTAEGARGAGSRGLRGFGRCGADFWRVRKVKYYWELRPGLVCGCYPETDRWHGGWLHNSFPYVLAPGKNGAVATVRFEMIREGLQESEARVFIERALTDPELQAKLGAELAERCQKLLDQRTRACRYTIKQGCAGENYVSWRWFLASGWQRCSEELYSAAAEVARKLDIK